MKKHTAAEKSDALEASLRTLIAQELAVDESEVEPSADLCDDLGADSLDHMEIIMSIEEKFGIEISDDDADDLKTVGALLDYVRAKQGK